MEKPTYHTNLAPLTELRLPLYPSVYGFLMNPIEAPPITEIDPVQSRKVINPYRKQSKAKMSTTPILSASSSSFSLKTKSIPKIPPSIKVKHEKLKPSSSVETKEDSKKTITADASTAIHIDLSMLDSSDEASVVGSSPSEVKNEECSIVSPPVIKKQKRDNSSVPPAPVPLHIIQRNNPLFFTYDPRGVKKGTPLPIGHCKHCRCPTIYCADIVLGKITTAHTEFLLYRNAKKSLVDESREALKYTFRECYSKAIMSKMRTNGIFFPWGFSLDIVYRLPWCVRDNSLMRFLHNVEEEKEREEEGSYDYIEDRFADLKKKYIAGGGAECKVYLNEPLNNTKME